MTVSSVSRKGESLNRLTGYTAKDVEPRPTKRGIQATGKRPPEKSGPLTTTLGKELTPRDCFQF